MCVYINVLRLTNALYVSYNVACFFSRLCERNIRRIETWLDVANSRDDVVEHE